MRATALAGEKLAGYAAVAMPVPSRSPLRVRDIGAVACHPKRRAPSS